MARDVVEQMRITEAPVYLGHLIRGIISRGRYGAIEVGFFTEIAIQLLT